MIWKELIRHALIGTERSRLPEKTMKALSDLGVPENLPAPQKLLNGVALIHQLQRTARELPIFEPALPPVFTADHSTYPGTQTKHHLRMILKGSFPFALPEFLRLLFYHAFYLPPETLPSLLDRSLKDAHLWQDIQKLIGPLGHWLIHQNPKWQALLPEANPDRWSRGTTEERQQIIRKLRLETPSEAIELMQQTWDKTYFKEKVVFLTLLFEGLHSTDEAFLEQCLDDSRKEVRQVAANLLSHLESSRLIQRLTGHIDQLITFPEKKVLHLDYPKALPKELIRDGIELQRKEDRGMTREESWLTQMTARIPPAHWCHRFDLDAETCLQHFAATKINQGLLKALTEASFRHQNEDWLEATLSYWAEHPADRQWIQTIDDQQIERIPSNVFNRVLSNYFDRNKRLPGASTLPGKLLVLCTQEWEDQLALSVVQSIQEWLADWHGLSRDTEEVRQYLQAVSYGCNPDLMDQFRKGWPMQSRSWIQWEKEVEKFFNTLFFRREMSRAITRN